MKSLFASAALFVATQLAVAQGTLVFDQQSSDENQILEGGIWASQSPVQSFTPNLDSVGFVRLRVYVTDFATGIAVNLRSGSPTGPLLGATSPIDRLSPYTGSLTFYFPIPISVTPGSTYFFEPVVAVGDAALNRSQFYNYSGGELFAGGMPFPQSSDLFFREGIVVPEPATSSVIIVGLALFGWWRFGNRLNHTANPTLRPGDYRRWRVL